MIKNQDIPKLNKISENQTVCYQSFQKAQKYTQRKQIPVGYRSLLQLKEGEKGEIDSFSDKFIEERALDLGLFPGKSITYYKSAPFKDPIIYNCEGLLVSLRNAEAKHIIIN